MKFVSIAVAVLFGLSAYAEEPLNVSELEIESIEQSDDGRLNINLEWENITTVNVEAAIQATDWLEVAGFVGVNAYRLINDEVKNPHLLYGARIRVPLIPSKDVYLEYTYNDIEDFGDQVGLLEREDAIGFVVKFGDQKRSFWGCNIHEVTHHAWASEDHAPETDTSFSCRVGKRIK